MWSSRRTIPGELVLRNADTDDPLIHRTAIEHPPQGGRSAGRWDAARTPGSSHTPVAEPTDTQTTIEHSIRNGGVLGRRIVGDTGEYYLDWERVREGVWPGGISDVQTPVG